MPRLAAAIPVPGPGWLFLIAGAAACAAGVLVPNLHDLREVRRVEQALEREVSHAADRVAAHGVFLDQLDDGDPVLLRRLAATQLNLVPAGEMPLLDGGARHSAVSDWIEAACPAPDLLPPPRPDTLLEQITLGPLRLWFVALGVLGVFAGLVLDCRGPAPRRLLRLDLDEPVGHLGASGRQRRTPMLAALLTPVGETAGERRR